MATAEALQRRFRRRARRKLLLEAIAVLGVTALGALIVYLVYRHPIGSPRKVAGTNEQNVSREVWIQTEVAVAVDPSNPRVLFAASNESLEPEIRVYTSTDGARTWSGADGPAFDPNTCAWGDPAVAVGSDGRQYVAFTEKSICAPGPDLTPYLVVGSRAGRTYQTTVVISSSDGGRTWSKPHVVARKLAQPQLVTIAAGAGGTVYLAGVDTHGLWVGRSTDGGRRFAVRTAAVPLPGSQAATCLVFGKFVLPQQAVRCLGPNPTITLGRD